MFNNVKVHLENCYGIRKMTYEFDFTGKNTYSIYAPNGTMKSSFAKTFFQLQNNEKPKDLMFPGRTTVCNITDENGDLINSENVFVIHPYSETYKSDKVSTLLLKESLKERYVNEYKKIEEAEDLLFNKLIPLCKLTSISEIKNEILETFEDDNIFNVIITQESIVFDGTPSIYEEIIYNELFNKVALIFLKDEKYTIKEYIERYDKLVNTSKYLGRDFNHYKARKTGDNLNKMQFFKGGHKVGFRNKETNDYIDIFDTTKFNGIIEQEESVLLSDPKIGDILDGLNKKIKNADLEKLRDYLFDNKHILKELYNIELFRKKLWIDYFKCNLNEYKNLLSKLKSGKVEIEKILTEAKIDKEYWKNAIEEFNLRFTVPFSLDADNIEEVLTKGVEPMIIFKFKDEYTGEEVVREKKQILEVLSQGEKRALYLLNIIFEINARKQKGLKTLFIIDDIADSFDYKNKYAIIQYLKDISEQTNIFKQIILTHNFDFFRTVQSRKIANYNQCLITIKDKNGINLVEAQGINNIFILDWKVNISKCNKKLIASIPFIRNLIEYTKGDSHVDYKILTSLLHQKNDTGTIKISEVERIFNETFLDVPDIVLVNRDTYVIDLIKTIADEIVNQPYSSRLDLENKIVLSIAIRIFSEKFIKSKIIDAIFLASLEVNKEQTSKLFKKYITDYNGDLSQSNNIKIIKEMMIMTPENIHLNSFMYEPILDMSDEHLIRLYLKVRTLNN